VGPEHPVPALELRVRAFEYRFAHLMLPDTESFNEYQVLACLLTARNLLCLRLLA
jgi:hypothetical protein